MADDPESKLQKALRLEREAESFTEKVVRWFASAFTWVADSGLAFPIVVAVLIVVLTLYIYNR